MVTIEDVQAKSDDKVSATTSRGEEMDQIFDNLFDKVPGSSTDSNGGGDFN